MYGYLQEEHILNPDKNCGRSKYPWKVIGHSKEGGGGGGRGTLKLNFLREHMLYEAKDELNFQRGGGGGFKLKKRFMGNRDVSWNHTFIINF